MFIFVLNLVFLAIHPLIVFYKMMDWKKFFNEP